MLLKQFRCADCGGSTGYRSRPRTFAEKYLLRMLLLRPVRCGECFRRCYRFLNTSVQERRDSGRSTHGAAA